VQLLQVIEIEGVAGKEVGLLVGGTAGGAERLSRFHLFYLL
jgi:hypothetical protein